MKHILFGVFLLQVFWAALAGLVAWWITHSMMWAFGIATATSLLVLLACWLVYGLCQAAGKVEQILQAAQKEAPRPHEISRAGLRHHEAGRDDTDPAC